MTYGLEKLLTSQFYEEVNYSLTGELINIHIQFSVLAGHDALWDRVLVSLVDITARKKAEAYLEYLGKHDSLTCLGNRAFYVEDLNRLSRRGLWPLCVIAIDLNGLKCVNDNQGYAAGDEFSVLMPNVDVHSAQALMDRIQP